MKFQNPRTGEIFEDIETHFAIFCNGQETCTGCQFYSMGKDMDCEWFTRCCPHKAAQLMGFEVIDDSKAVDFDQFAPDQTAKAGAGKARLSLVPFEIAYCIARVREHGTIKYHDPDNWKQVEPSRYVDALLRHTLAFAEDNQSLDAESGLPHLWHAACNLALLCEMLKEEYR